MSSRKFVIQIYELQFNNMMLLRAMIRVKTLPTCINGHLAKQLNTNATIDAAASSESKPKTFKDRSHEGGSQHLKVSTDESVSYYYLCSIRLDILLNAKNKDLSGFKV